MIADSHLHLDSPAFDSDRAEVIRRARDAGVDLLLTIGTGSPGDSSIENTLALADAHDCIYAGIGVHPHDARLATDAYWERLRGWAGHPKVVLWGEIGLDYHYDNSPREVQREVFRRQLRLARELQMPVSIHCREAWPDLMGILREERGDTPLSGIIHSFTGAVEEATACASLGLLISFSGIVTFKNAGALREAARGLELDRILVETDSPYLAPVPYRGKRNEPAFVVEVARALAEILGVSMEEVAGSSRSNLLGLLGLAGAKLC